MIGSKPPHVLSPEARKSRLRLKICLLISASSKEQAMEWGVLPGDQIVPYFEFTVMNDEKMLPAKAWDNRIGRAVAIDVMKNLHNTEHENIALQCCNCTRGSWPAWCQTARTTIQPDIGFATMLV
ncbi:hypothetical protein ACEQPO_21390 [Bacillus sp. SL00103]